MNSDYTTLFERMSTTLLSPWLETLPSQVKSVLAAPHHANKEKWCDLLQQLPRITPSFTNLQSDTIIIGAADDCDNNTRHTIEHLLRQFHPWRKGPYSLFGIQIDTEWRSDLKWNRLSNYIQPLEGRLVLDVGCGNGYHCWRMAGVGARLVIGIDPVLLYNMQFQAIHHFIQGNVVHLLPFGVEELPKNLTGFDTVFSMGVLYHRRSPVDHLQDLRLLLRNDGELVLETLVTDGGSTHVVIPEKRYAKMNNVWFLPSCSMIETLLKRCGFTNIRLINVNQTTTEEQRSTEWMTFESLPDFLDPVDQNFTVEGLPAPKRALFVATNP